MTDEPCPHGHIGACMDCLAELMAKLPPPPPPIPTATNTPLRETVAAAVRDNLKRRTFPPLAPGGMSFGLTEFDIADVMLAMVQPLLDAKQAEADGLRAELDAHLHQPILRLCIHPPCLRQFDASASLTGRPTRPEWSSEGWLQVRAVDGHVCPDHAPAVRAHTPRWLSTGKFLACGCGWESPPVRWRGYGAEAWKDHVITETEPTS